MQLVQWGHHLCWGLDATTLEKAMAPHSSTLAWKIPWTEEPGGLQSMGSHRVGHDWATSLSLFTFMHWRRKWQPTPVFLPRDSQGRGSLVGCRLWGRRVRHDWSDLAAADATTYYQATGPWTIMADSIAQKTSCCICYGCHKELLQDTTLLYLWFQVQGIFNL